MKRFTIAAAFLLLVAVSRDAAAQGFISPFLGTTLSSPSDAGSHTKPGYGVAFGALGKVIGGETEIAYFPELLDNSANAIAKNKIVTFSGNTLIGPTVGRVKQNGGRAAERSVDRAGGPGAVARASDASNRGPG